jgi:hypothetical protein
VAAVVPVDAAELAGNRLDTAGGAGGNRRDLGSAGVIAATCWGSGDGEILSEGSDGGQEEESHSFGGG